MFFFLFNWSLKQHWLYCCLLTWCQIGWMNSTAADELLLNCGLFLLYVMGVFLWDCRIVFLHMGTQALHVLVCIYTKWGEWNCVSHGCHQELGVAQSFVQCLLMLWLRLFLGGSEIQVLIWRFNPSLWLSYLEKDKLSFSVGAVTAELPTEPVVRAVFFTDQEGGLPCLLIPEGDTCKQCYKHWQEPVAYECAQKDKHSYIGYLLMKIISGTIPA